MRVTIWGARGSVPAPGPETQRYGGNTACVEVRGSDDTLLILDAGTGIRRMGEAVCCEFQKIHILLSHLHLDHIQGLGFFAPLYDPHVEVHVWGPASTTQDLRSRLIRYLSPPLFPIHMRELPNLVLHEVPNGDLEIGEFRIKSQLISHPGPTVGYRIESRQASIAYLPDHEPLMGATDWPADPNWISGYSLCREVDLLIHDGQFTPKSYPDRIGWGHSSLYDALRFAEIARVKRFATFHYDPNDDDEEVDALIKEAVALAKPSFEVVPSFEGLSIKVPSPQSAMAVA
ncbi:MAG TPA: MBL fold metallo-hydrolase [Fimbriimonadaceae bacterium]|nr:MBL fold metallo-hydrolase [Fimbriimonadaceae bacterium]